MENKEKQLQQEYLKLFDEIFEITNVQKYIDISQVPLLTVIYETVKENIGTLNPKYIELNQKQYKILDQLDKDWTKEQIDLFEKYCELQSEKELEMERQNFIFGVLICKELDRELKNCKSEKVEN